MRILLAKALSKIFQTFFKIRYGKKITWGKNIIVNHRFSFSGPGRLILNDGINMWAHKEPNEFFTYSPNAIITVGENCRLNGITVQCRNSATIGKECFIGSCMLIDNDFHSVYHETRNNPDFIKSAPNNRK